MHPRVDLADKTTLNTRFNARPPFADGQKARSHREIKTYSTMMQENYDPYVSEDERSLYEESIRPENGSPVTKKKILSIFLDEESLQVQKRPETGSLRAKENQGWDSQSPGGHRARTFEQLEDSAAYLEKERRSLVAQWVENAAEAEPEASARSASTSIGPASMGPTSASAPFVPPRLKTSDATPTPSNYRRARADTVSEQEAVVFEDMMMNNSRTM